MSDDENAVSEQQDDAFEQESVSELPDEEQSFETAEFASDSASVQMPDDTPDAIPAPDAAPDLTPSAAPDVTPDVTPVPATVPAPAAPIVSVDAPAPPSKRATGFFSRLAASVARFPELLVLAIILFAVNVALLWLDAHDLWFFLLSLPEESSAPSELITVLEYLARGCLVAMPVSVFLRLLAERRRNTSRPLSPLVPPVATLLVTVFAGLLSFIAADTSFEALAFVILAGLNIAACAGIAWLLATKQNEDHLFAHLLRAPLFSTLFCMVLFAGLALVLGAIYFLVSNFDERIFIMAVLFSWDLVFPILLASRLPEQGEQLETPQAYRTIATYVVLPVCLLLLVVLYIYIVRIALSATMPSGTMNWFGSLALLGYLALWLGLRMVETPFVKRFVRWGWILLLPVLAVQIWGIVIRVQAYGLTSLRYLGLACLAVGIVGLVLAALGASTRGLYLTAAIVALVVSITPLNIIDVPNFEQNIRLEQALERAGVLEQVRLSKTPTLKSVPPEDIRTQVTSSWDYLRTSEQGYLRFGLGAKLRSRVDKEPVNFETLFGFPEQSDDVDNIYIEPIENNISLSESSASSELSASGESSASGKTSESNAQSESSASGKTNNSSKSS